eukprot:m.23059 g.23059  ORF g.23059 m.23059 type:complete len:296 (-) comp4060_c0_seq1:301-1188(-)
MCNTFPHPLKALLLFFAAACMVVGSALLWDITQDAVLSEEEKRANEFQIAGFLFLWVAAAGAVTFSRIDKPTSTFGIVVAVGIFAYLVALSPSMRLVNVDDARHLVDQSTADSDRERHQKAFAGYVISYTGALLSLMASIRAPSGGNHICVKTLFALFSFLLAVGGCVVLWESSASKFASSATRNKVWAIAEATLATVLPTLFAALADVRSMAGAAGTIFGAVGLWVLQTLFEVRHAIERDGLPDYERTSIGGALCWLACLFAAATAFVVWREEERDIRWKPRRRYQVTEPHFAL